MRRVDEEQVFAVAAPGIADAYDKLAVVLGSQFAEELRDALDLREPAWRLLRGVWQIEVQAKLPVREIVRPQRGIVPTLPGDDPRDVDPPSAATDEGREPGVQALGHGVQVRAVNVIVEDVA